jgi:phthiocerol/phenolphthiocerol synthesis type-I polyketide synthase C
MNGSKIAIIGTSFRLPGDINDDKTLWKALINEKDLVTEISHDRFDTSRFIHKRENREGRSYTFSAGVMSNYDCFDSKFFNMSKKEILAIDPQHRMLLEISWEAIENACIDPIHLSGSKCGVFVGISNVDRTFEATNDLASMGPYSMTGNAVSIASNRISYFYNFKGPSLSVDTACSSSLTALHLACASIKSGEIDSALVGGVNLLLHPMPFVGFSKAHMLSPEGRCKSFSNSAKGYVRSEGCIVFMLKKLTQAIDDGDDIKAVILNTGMNNDGKTNGLPMPSVDGQYSLLKSVYNEINLDPSNVDYIEAHGTGTGIGDPIETEAISKAIASKKNNKLPIGSIKSNIGHLEPASGLAGLLKAILCIENKIVPPTIHCKKLNPDIDFDKLNIEVVNTPYKLRNDGDATIIGVSSFGFGGTNVHAVISEYIDKKTVKESNTVLPAALCPLFFAANSVTSLKNMASIYSEFIQKNKHKYYDIAYNSFYNRSSYKFFAVAYADSLEEITTDLKLFCETNSSSEPVPNVATGERINSIEKQALVFSGNGTQWYGMGRTIYANKEIKTYLDKIDKIYKKLSGISILDLMLYSDKNSIYEDTDIAQPALFMIQYAVTQFLISKGLEFCSVIGHSVGEVSAAWACGALSLENAAFLIYCRSKVQAKTKYLGKMCALGLNIEDVKSLIDKLDLTNLITIAGINSPELVTLSGDSNSIFTIINYCKSNEIYNHLLDLEYPFHSHYMDCMKNEFFKITNNLLNPKKTKYKFISTVYGKEIETKDLNKEYWWKNLREPVEFNKGVDSLLIDSHSAFIEIGPSPILLRSIRKCSEKFGKNSIVMNILDKDSDNLFDIDNALYRLWGMGYNWNTKKLLPFKAENIVLPKYCWDNEKYPLIPTVESTSISQIKKEHPLLGWRISNDLTIWENHIDAVNCNNLKDHIVTGSVIFPFAGFIEMAVAASYLTYKFEFSGIENIQVIAPLVLEEKITLQMQFRLEENGQFKIYTKPRLTDNIWTLHVSGKITTKEYYDKIDKLGSENRLKDIFEKVKGCEHYQICRNVGLEYGKSFQLVDELQVYENDVIVTLANGNQGGKYLFDPAYLDGVVQSIIPLFTNKQIKNSWDVFAYLPLSVDKIKFLNTSNKIKNAQLKIKSFTRTSAVLDINIYDFDNKVIMTLENARSSMADLFHVSKINKYYEYLPLLIAAHDNTNVSKKVEAFIKTFKHEVDEKLFEIYSILEQLTILNIINALKKIFENSEIEIKLYDKNEYTRLHWAINILIEQEYLLEICEGVYSWNNSIELLNYEEVFNLLVADYRNSLPLALHIGRMGFHMDKVLLGDCDYNNIISIKSGLYDELTKKSITTLPLRMAFKRYLDKIIDSLENYEKLNILEVGSGIFSEYLLDNKTKSINYKLITFNNLVAGKMDAEVMSVNTDDDLDFTESYIEYDLILCSDISFFENISNVLNNIKKILSKNGVVLINESNPCLLEYFINGLKPANYNSFFKSKKFIGMREKEAIVNIFTQSGFSNFGMSEDFESSDIGRFTLIFKKSENENQIGTDIALSDDKVIFFHKENDSKATSILKKLRHHYGSIEAYNSYSLDKKIDLKNIKHIYVVVHDTIAMEDLTVDMFIIDLVKQISYIGKKERVNLLILTSGGALCNDNSSIIRIRNPKHASIWALTRGISNEYDQVIAAKLIDIQSSKIDKNTFIKIINNKIEEEVIITEKAHYSLKLIQYENSAEINQRQVVKLKLSKQGSLNNLQWESEAPVECLQKNEVAIRPRAAGVNFRDIMYTLGVIPEEAVENSSIGASLGLDIAGEVIKVGANVKKISVGDRVMGFASGCFSNYVVTDKGALGKLPDDWSFEDGATAFTVFITSYYSLVYLANACKNEKILIHGAAGGVGLAAIQIAKNIGLDIYATAGTDEKRDFLRLLGVKNIYDSRTLLFADQIVRDTKGKGVDIVLNSLAGDAITASLQLLAPYGRFLELGKRDLYENNLIELKPFRNNISYFCVNVDQLNLWKQQLSKKLLKKLVLFFNKSIYKPLPYRSFDACKVKNAFKYMQQAKHIGKVVVNLDDIDKISAVGNETVLPDKLKLTGTYLVTGGTSGFGLATAQWLVTKGVKSLILVSRSGVLEADSIKFFEKHNVKLDIKSIDVTSYKELKNLKTEIKTDNLKLNGIIHAAAVYEDSLIENMTAEKYEKVMYTKIKGAYYLDLLFNNFKLSHFIVYSSATTFFGNTGQANYIAGNAYLESFIQFRRLNGKCGNYISFGPISDTGFLTRNLKLKQSLENQIGEGFISTKEALDALEKVIIENKPGFAVMGFNVNKMAKAMPIFYSSRFDVVRSDETVINTENKDFAEYLKNLDSEDARSELISIIGNEVAKFLEIPLDEIDLKKSLKELGFDSLMIFDFALVLEKKIGISIPKFSLQQIPNAENLANTLIDQIHNNVTEEQFEELLTSKHE